MSETISKETIESTYRYSVTHRADYIPGKYRYLVEGEWVEEDDMPESGRQHKLSGYLESVLQFLFRFEECYVGGDLIIYPKGKYEERVAPDVILVKGLSLTEAEIDDLISWEINPPLRPAPNVVFEISSDATWEVDILPKNKPLYYANLGVQEYFAYDPLGTWANAKTKLRGWRYQNKKGTEIQPDPQTGWLWSDALDSWVVADGSYVRLYDRKKKPRLTQVEGIQAALQEAERREKASQRREEKAKLKEQAALEQAKQEKEALERTIAELKAKLEQKPDTQ